MTLFGIIAALSIIAGAAPGIVHGSVYHHDPLIAAVQFVLGILFAFVLGCIGAGLVFALTWGKAGCFWLAAGAILVLIGWATVSYLGMVEEGAGPWPRAGFTYCLV